MRDKHQQLTRRTNVEIVVRNVTEVTLDEEALEFVVRGLWFRQSDGDPGLGTVQDLLVRKVATVGNNVEFVDAQDLLRRL